MPFYNQIIDDEVKSKYRSEDLDALIKIGKNDPKDLYNAVMERYFPTLPNTGLQQDLLCDLDLIRQYYYRPFPQITNFAKRNCLFLQLLSDLHCGKKYYTTRRNMPSFLLMYTESGKGSLTYRGKTYDLFPGDLFFIDCRKEHDYRSASPDGWRTKTVHFDGLSTAGYFQHILLNDSVKTHLSEDSETFKLLNRLFDYNLHYMHDAELVNHSLLTQLITELVRDLPQFYSEHVPCKIQIICDWLAEHYNEPVTLEQLSEQFNFSKYHICHSFKHHMNMSVFDFLLNERIKHAKDLLFYTNESVENIAEKVGYENQSNFSRMFLKKEGLTPSQYRKKLSAEH